MIDPATISIDDQIAELKRELALRANVYKAWVASGRLKPEAAERQIARMTAALHTLIRIKEHGTP